MSKYLKENQVPADAFDVPAMTSESVVPPANGNHSMSGALPEHNPQIFITAATAYLSRGWKVLPLQPPILGDKTTGKRPWDWHQGRGLLDWSKVVPVPDEATARRIWGHGEPLNIGIQTGEVSRLVAMDFDEFPEAFSEWQDRRSLQHIRC